MKIRKLMGEISELENTMHNQKMNIKTVFFKEIQQTR